VGHWREPRGYVLPLLYKPPKLSAQIMGDGGGDLEGDTACGDPCGQSNVASVDGTPLMHVKCIHELCSLLGHSLIFSCYMMLPTCFTLISVIFHKVPIYFVFNSRWQKSFCYYFGLFSSYGTPKRENSGSTVHKFRDASNESKWAIRRSTSYKWDTTMCSPFQAAWCKLFLPSELCLHQTWCHCLEFDLKRLYIYPWDFIS
jgi:hypothetical protein